MPQHAMTTPTYSLVFMLMCSQLPTKVDSSRVLMCTLLSYQSPSPYNIATTQRWCIVGVVVFSYQLPIKLAALEPIMLALLGTYVNMCITCTNLQEEKQTTTHACDALCACMLLLMLVVHTDKILRVPHLDSSSAQHTKSRLVFENALDCTYLSTIPATVFCILIPCIANADQGCFSVAIL